MGKNYNGLSPQKLEVFRWIDKNKHVLKTDSLKELEKTFPKVSKSSLSNWRSDYCRWIRCRIRGKKQLIDVFGCVENIDEKEQVVIPKLKEDIKTQESYLPIKQKKSLNKIVIDQNNDNSTNDLLDTDRYLTGDDSKPKIFVLAWLIRNKKLLEPKSECLKLLKEAFPNMDKSVLSKLRKKYIEATTVLNNFYPLIFELQK